MDKKNWRGMNNHAGTGAVYGLGFIGALIYFLQHAAGLGPIIIGILKSIIWPAFLVFKLFEFLKI